MGTTNIYNTNAGNVGIGTGTSFTPLGSLDVSAQNWVTFRNNVNAGSHSVPNSGANYGLAFGWNASGGAGESIISYGISSGTTPRLSFSSFNGTALTEEMSLKSGSLGTGISPAYRLDVYKTGINDPIARFGSSTATDSHSIGVFNGTNTFTKLFVAGLSVLL